MSGCAHQGAGVHHAFEKLAKKDLLDKKRLEIEPVSTESDGISSAFNQDKLKSAGSPYYRKLPS